MVLIILTFFLNIVGIDIETNKNVRDQNIRSSNVLHAPSKHMKSCLLSARQRNAIEWRFADGPMVAWLC